MSLSWTVCYRYENVDNTSHLFHRSSRRQARGKCHLPPKFENKYFSGEYRIKFRHFVNFSYICFWGKMSCSRKLNELICLWFLFINMSCFIQMCITIRQCIPSLSPSTTLVWSDHGENHNFQLHKQDISTSNWLYSNGCIYFIVFHTGSLHLMTAKRLIGWLG